MIESDREGSGNLQEQTRGSDRASQRDATYRRHGFGPRDLSDTLKDDDQIIEHDGPAVLLIDQGVSETLADATIDVEEHAAGARFVVRR